MAVLSRILQIARDWRYIDSIPRVKAFKENRGRTRFLPGDEAARLVAAIRDDLRPLIQFLISTGCRRGEALALDWDRVDLINRRVTFTHTKSGHSRTIPLSKTLTEALSALPSHEGRAFLITGSQIRKPLAAALVKAGIKGCVLHTLRRSAPSLMAQSNVPMQKIAEVLGHRSLITTRRYAHLQTDDLIDAVTAVEMALTSDPTGRSSSSR